jgi:hypothetical protein
MQLVLALVLLFVAVCSVFNLGYYPAVRRSVQAGDCRTASFSTHVAGLFPPINYTQRAQYLPSVFVEDPAVMDLDSRCYSLLSRDYSNVKDLTIVTGLFDLGRGKMNVSSNQFGFERKFEEYVERFKVRLPLGSIGVA